MEALSCRSAARCRTCEHALASGGCALEVAVDAALRPRPLLVVEALRLRSAA